MIQVAYNRLDRAAETTVLETCREQDFGVLDREPLANGYLSGKYRPGTRITSKGSRLESPEYRAAVLGRVPSGALVDPDDVARAVLYLASQRSAGVTGHVLVVDGGWTAA